MWYLLFSSSMHPSIMLLTAARRTTEDVLTCKWNGTSRKDVFLDVVNWVAFLCQVDASPLVGAAVGLVGNRAVAAREAEAHCERVGDDVIVPDTTFYVILDAPVPIVLNKSQTVK